MGFKFNARIGKQTSNPVGLTQFGEGVGRCPKCKENYILTKHHILPKRFFGPTKEVLELCRHCHNELERLIPRNEQMHENFYRKIVELFLKH